MAEPEKQAKPDPTLMTTEEEDAEEVMVNTQGLPIMVRELMGHLYWEAEGGPKGVIADIQRIATNAGKMCEFDPEGEVKRLDGVRIIGEFCQKIGAEYDRMMLRLHKISRRIEKPIEKTKAGKSADKQVQNAVAKAAARIAEEKAKKEDGTQSSNNRKPKTAARRKVSKAGNKSRSKRSA